MLSFCIPKADIYPKVKKQCFIWPGRIGEDEFPDWVYYGYLCVYFLHTSSRYLPTAGHLDT